MADFLRLVGNAMARRIAYVIVAAMLALLTSQCAHAADIPAVEVWGSGVDGDSAEYTSLTAACAGGAAFAGFQPKSQAGPFPNPKRGSCVSKIDENAAHDFQFTAYASWNCPSGVKTQTGVDTFMCIGATPPPTCQAGRILDSGNYASQSVTLACISGCQALRITTGPPQLNCSYGEGIGTCTNEYPAKYQDTGDQCSSPSTPDTKTPPEASPCPVCDCLRQGKSYGTVNGATVCLVAGTPGAAPVKTTPPPSSSSGNTTTNNTTTNNTTTTTTSSTVFNSDGTATTTTSTTSTTSTPATGSPTTTNTTETKPTGDFCKSNPKVSQCKVADEGAFGGDCNAGWSCEGDAVVCALTKRVHISRCEDMTKNAMTLKGDAAISGEYSDPDDPRLPGNTKVINIGEIDSSSGSLPSGGCISDKTVTMAGQVITLPFSKLCPYLDMLGNGLLAIAWLTAGLIVTGNRGGKT